MADKRFFKNQLSKLVILSIFFILTLGVSKFSIAQNAGQNVPLQNSQNNNNSLPNGPAGQQPPGNNQQGQIDVSAAVQQLIANYPNGGAEFISAIAALVVASPDSASAIINAVNQSPNKIHAKHAGQGLSQAVATINQTNPQAASQITALIAQSNNQDLQTAFLAGTGDQTAATNPGDGQQAGPGQGDADQPGATGDLPGGGPAGGTFPGGGAAGGTFPGGTGVGGGGGGTISPSA